MSLFHALKSRSLLILLILIAMSGWIVINELRSSWLQAHYFFRLASRLDYKLEKGPSPSIRFPKSGPYDERLGYGQIPEYTKSLTTRGFVVTEQVRMSPALLESPLAPIYAEKDQAGLMLLDHNQRLLYALLSPTRTYVSFDSIPKILIDTLLFIEDKELLNSHYPMRNPAVNWSRLDRALFDQALHVIHRQHDTPGASTLATQIEKYRHSPEGRTLSIHEKFLQMDSASIRSYLQGMDNMANRHQIVLAYLNTVPLTARMGYGEVNGLGDGMWMWYGRDFQEVNHLLQLHGDESLQQRAEAYKQALSLIIAQRRPSYFLREGSPVLMQMTNHYLKLLGSAHIISPALQRAALSLPLHLNHGPLIPQANSFVSHKAVNLLRNDLLSLLHITNLYALDRIDLNVKTTLDGDAQRAVTNLLRQVQSPAGARAAGLYGHNMLGENDNPQRLSFSFTLFERSSNSNLLRVQTDDLDQPFDINSGARLNLGSTSKLRTLITYLEIMTRLHQSYADMNQKDLQKIQAGSQDTLTRWALTYFVENPHSRLQDMLEAAMTRTYSGNPAEAFFTGGGLQKFKNFEPEKDDGIMTVREGFQHSVNLVFVRLMRDIVHHYEAQTLSVGVVGLVKTTPSNYNPITGSTTGTAEVSVNPSQQIQLSLFADREGREFLFRFYKKYKGKSPDEMLQTLVDGIHAKPKNLALIFRSVEPEASFLQFTAFMHHQLPEAELDEKSLQILYDKFAVEKYSLMDRGYLAGIHPLELWLVGYLFHHPKATLTQLVETSAQQRQEVYQWLFKSHNKKVQESRIRQMLELEAFQMIAADWRRLGYPFESLTPSYATALGASGDRPDSLAKLMGIVVNKGLLMPMVELQELQFAKGTPYETHFVSQPAAGVRMLPVEVTEVVRRSLIDVVQGGTGIRLKDGLVQKNGQVIEIGGKTGTGDQRFVSYAPNGKLIASRAVNRSATFVFLIGDRFFGTVTAYVHEPYAADYKFTSAMTVQLLKSLLPVLGMPAS